jgi:hypothetical protein
MGFSLYLYPSESHRPFTSRELTEFFYQQQFVLPTQDTYRLLAGPRLMEHITFLGCSPALSTEGCESEIHLHPFTDVHGMGGHSIETLRFPRCKHKIPDPSTLLSLPPSALWKCDQCDNSGINSEINWRKSAAYSDFFIEISSIFPKEAIPSEKFIKSLNLFSNSIWSWFYSHSSRS